MDFFTILICAIVAGVCFGIVKLMNDSERKKKSLAILGQLADFTATQQVMGVNGKTGLAFDEERKKVCLITWVQFQDRADLKVIELKDLLSTEIHEDGTAITRTSRTSQAGSALVGGLLFGGVGALVGGLTGKTVAADKVKRLCLRVVINDTTNPIHEVDFMTVEGKRDGIVYKQAIVQARHWNSILEILIKRADEEDKAAAKAAEPALPAVPALESKSVSVQLRELKSLLDDGILSQLEYEAQKAKVLQS